MLYHGLAKLRPNHWQKNYAYFICAGLDFFIVFFFHFTMQKCYEHLVRVLTLLILKTEVLNILYTCSGHFKKQISVVLTAVNIVKLDERR